MSFGRRLLFAFASLLLAISVIVLSVVVREFTHEGVKTLLVGSLVFFPFYLVWASPGVVLALPFIWIFKDADGWRALAILVIGSAIGPVFLCCWNGRPSLWDVRQFLVISLPIGVPTTLFYIGFLRYHSRRLCRRAEGSQLASVSEA